jgi:CDP-6-deoxy-D-xylo-4-hexulose-3-dehydrase
MQAACGLAQLQKLDEFVAQRRQNFAYLQERLRHCEEFLVIPQATASSEPSWFGFPLTLRAKAPCSRLDLLTYLDQEKVGTRLLFAGNLTRQPYMKNKNYRVHGELKNSDRIMADTFWIGVQPALTENMLDYSASKIEAYLGLHF